jgi:4-amino-4-deoxy-L-arabinose transferase-like glycosyltransferase
VAVIDLPRSGARDNARGADRTGARQWTGIRALPRAEATALVLVLGLSAGLNLVALNQEGFGNTYYAAAVWSMLQNWHAFLFASFDAGGFVSVDKPPVGLWVQVLSARLLGFNGVALLLPQALAGVASVAVLYALVRRTFGSAAACVAATVLAITPISVVADRNNTMDAILVLTLLLAVFAVSLAAERGSLGWLMLGAAGVGIGFNVKMLQAYPVVPGLGLAYLVCAPVSWRRRWADLCVALVVLVGVSLSWSALVDLTPESLRPYIGSSGNNSALSLALGYNGLSRLTLAIAQHVPALSLLGTSIDLQVAPILSPGIGNPGLLRLLAPTLAGQASWLLVFSLVGLVAGAVVVWRFNGPDGATVEDAVPSAGGANDLPGTWLGVVYVATSPGDAGIRRRQAIALVAWGGWLLVWAAVFSFARFYHVYYLIMLGPGVAALSGMGVVSLWRLYRDARAGFGRWLLPLALLVSLWVELGVVSLAPTVRGWLTPVLVGGTLLAVGALLLEYVLDVRHVRLARGAVACGMAALLIAPLAWSVISVQNGAGGGWLVEAGPNVGGGGLGGGFGGGMGGGLGGARGASGPGGGGAGGGGGPGGGRGGLPAGQAFGRNPGGSGRGFGGNAGNGGGSGGSGGGANPGGFGGGSAGGSSAPAGAAFGGGAPFGAGAAASAGGGAPFGGGGAASAGGGAPFGGGGGALTFAGPNWNHLDPVLVSYLEANQGSAHYLVATTTSSYASLFILDSGQPVMALGGYQGWDRILTPTQLAQQVADGVVRFFYLPQHRGGAARQATDSSLDGTSDLVAWVNANCTIVQTADWQSAGGLQLYDCQT